MFNEKPYVIVIDRGGNLFKIKDRTTTAWRAECSIKILFNHSMNVRYSFKFLDAKIKLLKHKVY